MVWERDYCWYVLLAAWLGWLTRNPGLIQWEACCRTWD